MEVDESAGGPNTALDVHIVDFHMDCIQLTDVHLCKIRILVNAGCQGAKLKVVIMNIYSLGYIQGCCGFINDP